MATDARKKMVRTTDRLLRQQGYHGTGLNQIVAESGAPKGSMYFHFPGGKAELAATAVVEFGEWKARVLGEMVVEHGSAADGVAAYLEAAATGFATVGFADGCTVATVSAEVAPSEPRLAAATAQALGHWTDLLRRRLIREGFTPDDAAGRALVAVTLIEGAVVVARGMQSTEPVHQAAEAVRQLLRAPGAPTS